MLVEHPFDVALAVRARRQSLKLSQAQLAAALGVGRNWVVQFEGGHASPDFALMMRALKTLAMPVNLRIAEAPPDWAKPLTKAARERAFLTAIPQTARTGEVPRERKVRVRRPPVGWSEDG